MSTAQIVLSSRVRLARNFNDLPFSTAENPQEAAVCIARTTNALTMSGVRDQYHLLRMADLSDVQRRSLEESHLISRDLLRMPQTAAVLLHEGENNAVSIMMNEEDHLRIQAICPGMDLLTAATRCFRVDDALSRHAEFAFDKQLGYLTACPTNTGTGMRASLLIHLPLLTQYKQMGSVGQIVAKVGLTIRGVYGEGSDALGHVYQISNQVTLGRTEQEIISTVTAVGHQLSDMECALRDRALKENRVTLEDTIFRAWGLMKHARLMGQNEFFKQWSAVRLGAAMGMLPVTTDMLDALLEQAQDAHLAAYAEQPLESAALSEARATRIRSLLKLRQNP